MRYWTHVDSVIEGRAITHIVACICMVSGACAYCHAGVNWESHELKPSVSLGAATVEFSFSFKNSGNFPVQFDAPKPTCGCTLTKLDKTVYAPGESGVLRGTYNTSGRRGLNTVAITVKGSELDGDIPRPFSETLKLIVNIPEVVKISPGITLWRKDSSVMAKVIRFEVNDALSIPLALTKISNETFSGEWIEIKAGKIYELMVAPASTAEVEQAVVTVEGVNEAGKTLRFHAHLIIR